MSEMRRLLMAQQEDNPWEVQDYLTIVPLEAKTMSITIVPTFAEIEEYDEENDEYYYYYYSCFMEYSKDGGNNWTTMYFQEYDYPVMSISIDGRKGETLKLRGDLLSFLDDLDYYGYEVHTPTEIGVSAAKYGNIAVAGSPLSLLSSNLTTAFSYVNKRLPNYIFPGLFANCKQLIKILNPKTFLPSTILGWECYKNMFAACSNLTNTPHLPALTLHNGCYSQMFYNCISLTTAPELPATELKDDCYYHMFDKCSSLTKAPDLPAIVIREYSYYAMFMNCVSLIEPPKMSATTCADWGCGNMFLGCSSLIRIELPASTLGYRSYDSMLKNCSALKYIKAMFLSAPITSRTSNWVSGVSSTGTFVKNKDAAWTNTFGVNAIPSGWAVITDAEENDEGGLIKFFAYDSLFDKVYTYPAVKGMTWSDWINSSYNSQGFEVIGEEIRNEDWLLLLTSQYGSPISPSDVIMENYEYYLA